MKPAGVYSIRPLCVCVCVCVFAKPFELLVSSKVLHCMLKSYNRLKQLREQTSTLYCMAIYMYT